MKLLKVFFLSATLVALSSCSLDDQAKYKYDHSVLGTTSLTINQYNIDIDSTGFPKNLGDIEDVAMIAGSSGMVRTFGLIVNDECKHDAIIKATSTFKDVKNSLTIDTANKKCKLTITRKGYDESIVYNITFTK